MVPSAFEPFLKEAPFCVMARAALESLFSRERLDALFARTARTQYTRDLLFSQLVELLTAVVLRQQPSVRAAFHKGTGGVTVSNQAVYDKLNGLELGVSAALVRDSAERLAPVLRTLHARHPAAVKGYRVRILDGNALSATQRRLPEMRSAWDAPLPGRVLAVLDPRTELVTDVFLTPNGHDQERSLIADVLGVVRPRDVWVADRNFCTRAFLLGLSVAKAAFVIREHAGLGGTPVGARVRVGRGETGVVYEQRFEVEHAGRTLGFRRVSVVLDAPTQDGDTEVHVLTNLPADVAGGVSVGELYRGRWTIEGRFLEMSRALNAEPHTLCYPPAALFAFCLGLVASNAFALLRGAVRAVHGEAARAGLSSYAVALDIQQMHRGMMVALPAVQWEVFRDMTAAELAAAMKHMAAAIDRKRYRKTTRGPKKPTGPKRYKNGGHVATYKLLLKRKE
jgi:hypothetical protein